MRSNTYEQGRHSRLRARNQPYKFLEGENEKVSFLRNRFNIQTEDLPFRTYSNPRNSKSTVRYFVDRFPMFGQGMVTLKSASSLSHSSILVSQQFSRS